MLANSMIGVMSMMSVGLKEATIKYVSAHLANNNVDGIIRVVQSALTMHGILGISLVIATYFIAPFIVNHIIKVKPENVHLAITAIQIAGIGRAVRFFDGVFRAVLQGHQRHDLSAKVTMVANLMTLLVSFGLVLFGYGVIHILFATIVIIGLSGLAKTFVAWRVLLPSLRLRPLFDRDVLKTLFSFGIYSWLQEIGNSLFYQADRLIIASRLSLSALTYYTVCSQLAQQIYAVLNRATYFLFPLSSTTQEKGNLTLMRTLYFRGLNFVTIASVGLSIPLFLFASNMLSLWMGIEFAKETANVLRVLTVTFSLLSTAIVPYYFMNGTGFVRLNTVFCFISGVVVGLSTVLLVPSLGILGAALARLSNIPIDVIGRTTFHYKGLSDRRWYAGLSTFAPVLLVFLVTTIVFTRVGDFSLNLSFMLPMMVIVSLVGVILASMLCRFFNPQKRDFKDCDRL